MNDHHLPPFLIIPRKNQIQYPPKANIFSRNFKNFDRENFMLDLLSIDWDTIIDTERNDVNYSTEQFLIKINSLLDIYAPFKKISKNKLKSNSKPWIDDSIIKKINKKNNILKKLIASKDPLKKKLAYKIHLKYKKTSSTTLLRTGRKNIMKTISAKRKVIYERYGKV